MMQHIFGFQKWKYHSNSNLFPKDFLNVPDFGDWPFVTTNLKSNTELFLFSYYDRATRCSWKVAKLHQHFIIHIHEVKFAIMIAGGVLEHCRFLSNQHIFRKKYVYSVLFVDNRQSECLKRMTKLTKILWNEATNAHSLPS